MSTKIPVVQPVLTGLLAALRAGRDLGDRVGTYEWLQGQGYCLAAEWSISHAEEYQKGCFFGFTPDVRAEEERWESVWQKHADPNYYSRLRSPFEQARCCGSHERCKVQPPEGISWRVSVAKK